MNSFRTTLLALLLALVALPAAAQTRSTDIQSMLQQRDREIKTLLGTQDTFTQAQRDQLKTLINDVIDFRAMSELALGTHWDDLTAAERDRFVDVFSEIVRNQSLSNLDIYRAPVTYQNVDVDGDAARVTTTTVYKETPATVIYVMGLEEGTWRVHDIVLDDVSTAEGYARSFQRVILRKGFDALMASLEKKLASTAG